MTEAPVRKRIRGRVLFLYFAASMLGAAILTTLIRPSWFDDTFFDPIGESVFGLIWYSILLVMLVRPIRRQPNVVGNAFRKWPSVSASRWAVATGTAAFAVSLASVYFVYLPLSYAVPDYVQRTLFDDATRLLWTHGEHFALANCISLFTIIFLAPFVEEVFFRGLLLSSWASAWGAKRAVVWSSIVFGLLHLELGPLIFGFVASFAFLRYRSLWHPFIIHATNNAIVSVWYGGELLVSGEAAGSVSEFQESWWVGAIAALIGVPLLVYLLRRTPALSPSSQLARLHDL